MLLPAPVCRVAGIASEADAQAPVATAGLPRLPVGFRAAGGTYPLPLGGDGRIAWKDERDQTMNIALPPEIERRLTEAEAKLHLVIGLFAGEKVTFGQAAAIAGISQPAFLQELGKRKIAVHYGLDELDADIDAVEKMVGR